MGATSESMNSLQVNGTELACVERGEGQTAILVHGAIGDLRSWESVAIKLAARYRVVTYSRRWHYPLYGATNGDGYTAAIHTADLLGVMEHFGPSHLVGHSYGAALCAAAALQRPGLVKSLVLAEPSLFPLLQFSAEGKQAEAEAATASAHIPELLKQGQRVRALHEFLNIILGDNGAERIPALGQEVMLDNLSTLAPMLAEMRADSQFTPHHAAAIKPPTLLLDGEHTPAIFRITIEEMQKAIPNVRRVTLPDVSHGLHLENPTLFTETVQEFLAQFQKQPAMA